MLFINKSGYRFMIICLGKHLIIYNYKYDHMVKRLLTIYNQTISNNVF